MLAEVCVILCMRPFSQNDRWEKKGHSSVREISDAQSQSRILLGWQQHWWYCPHFSCLFVFFKMLVMKEGVPQSCCEEIDEE